ncbi:MAG: hypothetical protein ABIY47_14775 [Opitutaceae bacterium]
MVEKKSAFSADFNPIISGRSYFEEDTLRKRPFRIALGLAVESDERSSILTSAVIVPREFIDRVRRDAPQYQLSAEIQLMRPVVMGEKPARTSERIVSGRETTRIIAGVNGSEFRSAPFFRLQEYQPTIFGTENGMGGVGPFDFGFWPKRSYFLVDRKLGYLSTNFFSEYDARRTTVVRIGTVGIVWRQLSGSPSESFPSRAPSPPEDLSIAKVEFRAVERFTKELRVDQFQLGLSQRRGRAAR